MREYLHLFIVTAIGGLVAAVCAKYQATWGTYFVGVLVGGVGVSILEDEE